MLWIYIIGQDYTSYFHFEIAIEDELKQFKSDLVTHDRKTVAKSAHKRDKKDGKKVKDYTDIQRVNVADTPAQSIGIKESH